MQTEIRKSKQWLAGWGALCVILLVIAAAAVWQVDPFFHFHAPDTERYYYFDTGYYAWIFRRGLLASAGLLLPVVRLNHLVAEKGRVQDIMLLLCAGLYFCMEKNNILLLMPMLAFAGRFITQSYSV